MSRTNWKGFERFVARALGVERYSKGHLGESAPDVVKKFGDYTLIIECRNRKILKLEEYMKDAKSYRKGSKDIIILCYRKTNSKMIDVFLTIKDFEKLYYQSTNICQKTYLQIQEIVLKLDWNDFLYIVKVAENAINHSHKRSKKK